MTEPSVDRAFSHVVWAAHILCDFSASHDKLIQEKRPLDSIGESDSQNDDDDDGDEDEGSLGADIRSHINDALVPYTATLREKSLDCIAELLSRKKGWHCVTATALREQEDSAEVDIARNSGFDDNNDEEYLLLLEEFMAAHHEAGGRYEWNSSGEAF